MISYHPDSRFLTDFAAANLPLSQAVCVSAHLEFCGKCRAHVQQLTEIGGHLLSRMEPEEVAQDSFDRLMTRIATVSHGDPADAAVLPEPLPSAPETVPALQAGAGMFLPRALRRLSRGDLHTLSWVQLSKALRVAPLRIPGDGRETAIYDIRAGGRMPEHDHGGEEITVLLQGSFSDAEGSYGRGDFVVRNAGEAHQPTATRDMDCLCLVSLERPIRPRSLLYRLLTPYVQYRLRKLVDRNPAQA